MRYPLHSQARRHVIFLGILTALTVVSSIILITGYHVSGNSSSLATTTPPSNGDSGLTSPTITRYANSALSAAVNESASSASLSVTRVSASPPSLSPTATYSISPPTATTRFAGAQPPDPFAPCNPPATNVIACENSKLGNPASEWDIAGAGSANIQGFATDISVNRGEIVRFKIDTNASNYRLDIYRLGYYGGMGARLIATVQPSAPLPQTQPTCLTDPSTGLVDCGNWAESASWAVPSNATSGIYIAKLVREIGATGMSHVVFIVRDDNGGSDLLFQTSDTTWQAYNSYGGNSLYTGSPVGRAYKVSYNRPFNTREGIESHDWLFDGEYPMVRWLEANGYNVSYFTGVDSDRRGAEILEHRVFLSVGHDEYWSGAQRINVESARNAGVHLAFFSGNIMFWKTRWENSIDVSSTPFRTLVCYKETHANAKIDPLPNVWTGTWRDPRFSPPADGGRPENALIGTIFTVNGSQEDAIKVPEALGKFRFWRNTTVATQSPNQIATVGPGTVGYEWDEDLNNGFRPSGLIRLSTNTVNVGGYLQDYGSTYGPGTATHSLTLYRHSSGALVFSAGATRWSWGLDNEHDQSDASTIPPPDTRMRQATVNLLADMNVQPATLQPGLIAASQSTDTLQPTSTIASPTAGSTVPLGNAVTITGTASDNGGGTVAVVEVSVNNGATWNRATGTSSWTYNWVPSATGPVTIKTRAFDDSGNAQNPPGEVTVTVGTAPPQCPCSLWGSGVTPTIAADPDSSAVELGVKFQADVNGYVTGLRFYKGATNTGTHLGSLWTSTGTLLTSVTFTGETASGWQQVTLATPVAINANTTYVVSYHTTVGHYSLDEGYFSTAGVINGPLRAPATGAVGGNGVYKYGATGFPTETFSASNYWVDLVFTTTPPAPDTTPPTVTSFTPAAGATNVSAGSNVTVTFSEAMDAATVNTNTVELRDHLNNLVSATVTYDAPTRTATLDPNAALIAGETYTALVKGGSVDPRVKDVAGNALAANLTWTFTIETPPQCPCSLWGNGVTPTIAADPDSSAVELGVKFQADVSGYVTGLRFYKGATNTGTHLGSLWTSTGTLLASVTFTGETASGWQQVTLATPVAINANTTYVVSYHTNVGHYSFDENYFATTGVVNGPLRAPATGAVGGNGVYKYGATGFPTQTYNASNYWVDLVFSTTPPGQDTTPPTVASFTPAAGATNVSTGSNVTVTFSEAMDAATVNTNTVELRDHLNNPVPATVSYDAPTSTATLDPTAALTAGETYTAQVRGGSVDPRVKDVAGNALAANFTWTFTTATPPPPDGPGGPILVITSTGNKFTQYYKEILRAEGFNNFKAIDMTQVDAAVLAQYDIAILGEMLLTPSYVSMLGDWVTAGGNLIAMRPDKQLATLLGINDSTSTRSDAYLLVNTTQEPGAGIVNETIQYHSTADLYTLAGATQVAAIYSSATQATSNPAVTLRSVGTSGGQAAAFTFDLARSIVYTRQGNPAWAGQERDGFAPIRPNDLYFPGYLDLDKAAIPQADELQRLLGNMVVSMNLDKRPLPHFWYFPNMKKAIILMTGDDHGTQEGTKTTFDMLLAESPPGCSVADWECYRATGWLYTSSGLTDTEALTYHNQGFELGVHVTTGCTDWTPETLDSFFADDLASFTAKYLSIPPQKTNRTHCLPWSDWATHPGIELNHGIRLDETYYYWPPSWIQNRPGFMTGSGMPMRFADLDGSIIDVYQAATHLVNENGVTYPAGINSMLDKALGPDGYYGVFGTHYDHSDNFDEQLLNSAKTRNVSLITARQLLTWLDGRNASSFGNTTWNGAQLGFSISVGAGASNLYAMIPNQTLGGQLSTLTINGASVSFTVQTIKGRTYAVFRAATGNVTATYAP